MSARPRREPGEPESRHRRLFIALLCLLVLGSIELGSWILLRFVPKSPAVETARVARGPVSDLPPRVQARRHRLRKSVLHPFLGQVLNPEVAVGHKKPKAWTEAQDFGFSRAKSGRIFYPPSDDRIVAAIFGGSVANVLGNIGQKTLVEELGRAERFAGKEIVVVNLGQGGYKQPQQLISLNYFLSLGAHFDVVINLDGFNDIALAPAALVNRGIFPFFPQSWYFLVQDLDADQRRAIGELTYLRTRTRERAAAFSASPLRFSPTATLLWRIADRRLARTLVAAERALDEAEGGSTTSYQTRGPDREYSSPEELATELAGVWQRSSLQMHALCTTLGIEYHHFLQPNQYVPSSKPLSDEERRDAYDENHRYAAGAMAGYPLLSARGAELRERGIHFHDLTRVFADVSETIYVDTCCHINWLGNRILASRIARAITATDPL